MSMQFGNGAACAASEILNLIKQLKDVGASNKQIVKEVEKRLKEIRTAGIAGWY